MATGFYEFKGNTNISKKPPFSLVGSQIRSGCLTKRPPLNSPLSEARLSAVSVLTEGSGRVALSGGLPVNDRNRKVDK